MHKSIMSISILTSILIFVFLIGLSGCIEQKPSSMSVKIHVYVSGNNETITPNEQTISMNRSSNATVFFTLHAVEPRDYSQIAISINVSGIYDPIVCPTNFSNYMRNDSNYTTNFNKTVIIPVTLSTKDILPENMQTVTIYYSSKEPNL